MSATVRLDVPEALTDRAETVLDNGGYGTVGELMRDAIRRRIEDLERRD